VFRIPIPDFPRHLALPSKWGIANEAHVVPWYLHLLLWVHQELGNIHLERVLLLYSRVQWEEVEGMDRGVVLVGFQGIYEDAFTSGGFNELD
jgi:hypothetical protein